MKFDFTKKEIDLLMLAMKGYEVAGHWSSESRVTTKEAKTARGIIEKLNDYYFTLVL